MGRRWGSVLTIRRLIYVKLQIKGDSVIELNLTFELEYCTTLKILGHSKMLKILRRVCRVLQNYNLCIISLRHKLKFLYEIRLLIASI